MNSFRFAALLALVLLTASCASKTPVDSGFSLSSSQSREALDPDLDQPSPPKVGDSVLTPQEHQALRSSGDIRFTTTGRAQEQIREQFLFLSRNVRFKMENWIARGERYLPHARQVFTSRGLPEDLIYLAFIESGYNPKAYSRSGAAGCWQFMPFTGRRFGLSVDWWVDERRDPYKAAYAAAEYLAKLHEMFNDWELAVAAYNAGEGKIGRALKASGARNFYELVQRNHSLDQKTRLRDETLRYVPRFAAMVKIARNLKLLGFREINWNAAPRLQKVQVPGGTDLKQLAQAANMPFADFENHNPAFRRETTPPARSSVVYVPATSVASVERYLATPASRKYAGYQNYTVRRGDSWSHIANRFGVDVATLKGVNNRRTNLLHAGQRIIVPTRESSTASAAKTSAPARNVKQTTTTASSSTPISRTMSRSKSSTTAYTVRNGDTLYSLARRHNISVGTLQQANGLRGPQDLRAGMTLRIPGRGSVASAPAPSPSRTVYRVRHGDTVWSIARDFKVSPYQLMEWNNLSKNAVIQPGDQISLYR